LNRFIAVDYASENGDYTCISYWYIDKNGTIIVDAIDYIRRKEERIKRMNEIRLWKVESTILREAYLNVFAPCSSYFELKKHWKEVRKKMAIDYGKEWKLLQQIYGKYTIQDTRGIPSIPTTLDEVMDFQIQHTIAQREKLMQEFVKERITTNIDGGTRNSHNVNFIFRGGRITNISVLKEEFANWCKKKERR